MNNRYSRLHILLISNIIIVLVLCLRLDAQEGPTIKETAENIEAGKNIYMKKCQYCHGVNGDGDGPAAYYLDPMPRDLTRARYKIISTEAGEIPTDKDIFDVIANGLPDTSMPAWASLSKKEIWQTVYFIKTFAERFDWYKEINKAPVIVEIGSPPPATEESIERGRLLYMEKLECWKCHGEGGRGDGPSTLELVDEWEFPIKPTNLTKPWKFKVGSTRRDIFRTIITGVAGTPMPSFLTGNTEEELWDLVNYVQSLCVKERPQKAIVLKSEFVTDNLPEDIDDTLWDTVEKMEFSVFGQILVEPRMFTPSADEVYVKSVYNEKEVAFLIEWEDNSQSLPGIIKAEAETEEGYDGYEEEEDIVIYADALAVQFPVQIPETTASSRPFFLLGDTLLPVNLWYWESESNDVQEINAWGSKKKRDQSEENKDVTCKAIYYQGQYKLLVKRSLTTPDKEDDIQIEFNKFIPIAFFVWDGHNGETEDMMAISCWYYLFLEKKETGKSYLFFIIAVLFTIAVEIIIVRIIRKNGQVA